MSKRLKLSLIVLILVILCSINTRLSIQPQYDRYVISLKYPSIYVVFNSNTILSIVIYDKMFIEASQEVYNNL